ncbi:MAG TPA: beta-propeller fold lactonase family protein [Solirubrobacteraceae bacterium]|nr:beta-propeller fold lactonase family protein [Solirubrobacteraceae bacterium]
MVGIAGLLAGAALWLAPGAFAANSIYWTTFSGSTVSFANLDGTGGGADLATPGASTSETLGTAIDPATGRIYWANYAGNSISYASLDGSGGGDLNTTGATALNQPWGVAIDPAAGRIYWANFGASKISYANLDGSGGGDLNTTGATVTGPSGVVVDPVTGKVYWTNFAGAKISYANLNNTGGGGDLTTTGATSTSPAGLAIDSANGKIYWTNYSGANSISFANVNNTGGAGNLTVTGTTVSSPMGIAIDPVAGKLYWANYGNATVSSANLDGSSAVNLATGAASTNGLAYPSLLEMPSGAGVPAASGGATAPSTLSCSQGTWAGDVPESFLYRAPRSFTYQWSLNGSAIPGATSSSYLAAAAGQYTCAVTATNRAGSAAQTSAPLTVASAPAVLAVAKTGTGSGTVTSSPGAINCGPICSASLPFGTEVALTAKPAHGSEFAGWSGACTGTSTCSVTMSANRAVTASFAKIPRPDTRITSSAISAKKRTAAFRFRAVGTATGFQCALVKQPTKHHKKAKVVFRGCSSPKHYQHLAHGHYAFYVRAVNAAGVDPTPAKKAFKI